MNSKITENILTGILICLIVGILIFMCSMLGKEVLQILNVKPQIQEFVQVESKKPSYDYLKSVTVYLVHPSIDSLTGQKGYSVGTGTIVTQKDGFAYIMTNKHVCGTNKNGEESLFFGNILEDEEPVYTPDENNCYISSINDYHKFDIKLQFVKQAKDGIDLALWKTEAFNLKDKNSLKGVTISHVQDRVFSVGSYLAIGEIYSEGTMAGYETGSEVYNLPSAPGCSGSGIFNENGELVAVLYAGNMVTLFQSDTAKAIAVAGIDVKEFLKGLI